MDAYPDFVEALVGAGVPGRIVRLLRQRDPAPAEKVVGELACVLGNMCLWDVAAVVRAGAVGALVPWLKQPEQEVARYTMAQVLRNVVRRAAAAGAAGVRGGVRQAVGGHHAVAAGAARPLRGCGGGSGRV
jgi:hypothetical protein